MRQADVPKPTDGLEYTYARKSSAYNPEKKDVAHIWELSGGEELADEVLKSEHLFLGQKQVTTAVVVIAVDLSQPAEVLDTLLFWLEKVRLKLQVTLPPTSPPPPPPPNHTRRTIKWSMLAQGTHLCGASIPERSCPLHRTFVKTDGNLDASTPACIPPPATPSCSVSRPTNALPFLTYLPSDDCWVMSPRWRVAPPLHHGTPGRRGFIDFSHRVSHLLPVPRQTSYTKLEQRGSKLPEQLRIRARKLFGSNHEDKDTIDHTGKRLPATRPPWCLPPIGTSK